MLDVTREEKKYVTDPVGMELLKRRLNTFMESDKHNNGTGYIVRSLYFDSINDMDYFAKADGLDVRKKVRLRIYSPDDKVAKLEVKEKAAGMQRKRSLSVTREEALQISQGYYECLACKDDDFAKALYLLMTKELYRPKAVIEYDRYAFISPDNNIRVTFDQNLRAEPFADNLFKQGKLGYPVTSSQEITLEVKYDGFLHSGIKMALAGDIGISVSNSKYCRAREKFGY